jgi:SAM-dependent methyltransferase
MDRRPRPGARPRRFGRRRPEDDADDDELIVGAPRARRALSHVGGTIQLRGGSEAERRALETALAVEPDEEATLAHVHGFHSYPARLHPETARRLVAELSPRGGTVLDPFCGSGTVLVEARLAGRRAVGVDLSPLAVALAGLKTSAPGLAWTRDIEPGAERVAEHAEERRKKRAGATRRYGEEDVALFDPHVLLELDGLREGIDRIEPDALRRALLLVLSASLTKISKRGGDTTHLGPPKRIAGGYTIRLFVKKARDLAVRLAQASELLPADALPARIAVADARRLLRVSDKSVELVVTSPPYPGIYDYLEHHRARMRWLGLDARALEEHEIGARRHARRRSFAYAFGRFRSEMGSALAEIGRVLRPNGLAVVVSADSVLDNRAVRSDALFSDLAPSAGLEVVAVASQERPHFHAPTRGAFRDRPRHEHAVLLRRSGGTALRANFATPREPEADSDER